MRRIAENVPEPTARPLLRSSLPPSPFSVPFASWFKRCSSSSFSTFSFHPPWARRLHSFLLLSGRRRVLSTEGKGRAENVEKEHWKERGKGRRAIKMLKRF